MSDDLRIETLGHDSLAVSQERTENGTGVTPPEGVITRPYHLPECPQFCDGKPPKCRGGDCTLCDEVDCYCDRLRACEQRIQETNIHSLLRQEDMRIGIKKGRTAQFKEMKMQVKDAAKEGHAFGYAAALRDAVEAVKLSCSADIELVERTEVIAVIEALKEKP